MPRDIQVSGAYGYQPTKQQIQRLQTFLQWLPTKKAPTEVVIVPPEKMGEVSKIYSQVPTNVGLTVGSRSYINAKLFDPKDDFVKNELGPEAKFPSGSALEWTLAHEASHLNDSTSHLIQERRDYLQNAAANEAVTNYNNPQGTAYQSLQKQVDGSQGQIQPTSAPIATQLSDAPYSLARSQRP